MQHSTNPAAPQPCSSRRTTVETHRNNRLQPATYQVQQQFSGTLPSVCTAMTTVADIMDFTYNFKDSSNHNNGNVQKISNNIDWHRTQSFTYDALNRIATAQTNATNQPAFQGDSNSILDCWAESFTYDPWGNILTLGPNTTTQPNYVGCTQESGFNYTGAIAANNRVATAGFTYDSAGNMIAGPGTTYTYDAENHLVSTAGVTYTYDGDGKRVEKSNGTLYWYGMSSDPLIESDLSNNLKYQYMFFNGQRVGREDGSTGSLGISATISAAPASPGASTASTPPISTLSAANASSPPEPTTPINSPPKNATLKVDSTTSAPASTPPSWAASCRQIGARSLRMCLTLTCTLRRHSISIATPAIIPCVILIWTATAFPSAASSVGPSVAWLQMADRSHSRKMLRSGRQKERALSLTTRSTLWDRWEIRPRP